MAGVPWKILGAVIGCVVAFGVLLSDRKSTRLNSSHTVISYAVFCLKKKKQCKDKFKQSQQSGGHGLDMGWNEKG